MAKSPAHALPVVGAISRLGPRVAGLNAVAAAVAGILYCAGGTVHAADTDTAASASTETSALDEIVVTASARGVKKLDASYNIISVDAEAIKMANPKSTADVLKLSPGIWPESSGGQTGANIEIAGIPGGGDAPFFTNMVNGSPLYGMPSLSFMDSSSLLRLDDTVERVEVVQGGPGAIFGPGQMGATANFILKRGTADPTGSVGVTYGSEGLVRVDAFYGFPIADKWYVSAGGFYRESHGVRSPQFDADDGGQFTATLSHDMDNGSFMLWGRTLNEKNQFIVPVPLIESANGDFSNYPGFNALTSAYGSRAMQNVLLPNPAGGFESADLANGRGGNLNFFGGNYDADFNGWKVSDKFIWDIGSLNTNALFSGPNPRPLNYYLYGCQVAQPAGYCNGATAVDSNNLGAGGQGLPLATNVSASYLGGGPVAGDQSVITQGWWYIQKKLNNLNNEFRVSKEIFDGNTATAGLYLTHYTDHDNWSLGNTMLMSNTPNATPIILSYVNGGNTYHLTSPQGFVSFNNNYNILEDGEGTNTAPYLSDSWKLDKWLFDVGARYEHISVRQDTCNRSPVQLGTAFDLWDNATPVCNGTYDVEHYSKNATSWTVGVNYEIFSNMSAYVRVNNGTHFDDFDNGIRGVSPNGNFSPVETLKNYEGGFKFQNSIAYVDMSLYHKQFTGLQYQETNSVGVGTGAIANYGSDSKGIDLIATLTPIPHLNLTVVGDYMDGHYTHFDGCAPYTDINGNAQCAAIDGAPLQRQPKLQVRFTPSYQVLPSWGDATGWVTYEHVGQRYEDISGLQPLGAYYMLSAGIVANYGKNWQVRLQGTNLTNQIGLTEGNARKFGVQSGIGGVILARPIEGREINIGVKYKF
ncbi:MAG TPA: TonB-dependent receptor [Steroidobacteraceae bacterium]|nr:TonB-dependent receptor [Steroidobacteraceae bacterium]